MTEMKEEAGSAPKVGIGVGNGDSGRDALRWALEKKVVPPYGHIYLLRVNPPVRLIPNEMGAHFPVEKASPWMVARFKEGQLLKMEKLVESYRRLCEKSKVKCTVCYSENDSVHKGIVDQILKLGIAIMILGTSSSSGLLPRPLKKESIPKYVAKNAPDFCKVNVICKGKVSFGSPPSVSAANEARTLRGTVSENASMTSDSSQDMEESIWSEDKDSDASMERSQSYPAWLLSDNRSGNTSSHSPLMMRNYSSPSGCCSSESTPATSFHHRTWQPNFHSACAINQFGAQEGPQSVTSLAEGKHTSIQAHDWADQRMPPLDLTGLCASTNLDENPLKLASCSDQEELYQAGMDLGTMENLKDPSAQRMHDQLALENIYSLQSGLNEATQSAQLALREAERQASSIKMAEKVVAGAMKMIAEHDRHRQEALKEANFAKQQAIKDSRRCEEALAALQKSVSERDILQKMLAEETRKHKEMQAQLEVQRRLADAYKVDAETERKKCEEALTNLAEITRKLEVEIQLKKAAEVRASEELVAKLEAVAALQKQQRYMDYTFEQLQSATNDFHEENKLGQGGYGPVFKGKLHHTTVAIKVLANDDSHARTEFQSEIEVLSRIRHPHMVMLLGACPEKGCIVYEYMANGSLEDRLRCTNGTPPLPWYDRFRICFEVASALLFLHSRSEPIVHRDLKPGNILLDLHLVSKISDVGLARLVPNNLTFNGPTMYKDTMLAGTFPYIDPDYQRTGVVSCESDVYALGLIILQLLTGRPVVGVTSLVEKAVNRAEFYEVLDKSAGEWPLDEALALARLGLDCAEPKRRDRPKLKEILPNLEIIQHVAAQTVASTACGGNHGGSTHCSR